MHSSERESCYSAIQTDRKDHHGRSLTGRSGRNGNVLITPASAMASSSCYATQDDCAWQTLITGARKGYSRPY